MKMILLKDRGYRNTAGFMLAETMMSFGIAGVAIVSLYAGISQSFASIRMARENQRATQILVERMESLRLITWDQLNTPGFVPTEFRESFHQATLPNVTTPTLLETKKVDASPAAMPAANPGIVYVGHVEIDQKLVPSVYQNHMRRVNITLSWRSGQSVRQRNMETFVSEYGVQNYNY